MTKDEALKLALEAMEYADACLKKQLTMKYKHEYAQDLLLEAGTAIKEALAQPEQEPVAWNVIDPTGKIVATEMNSVRGWARIEGYKPTVEGLLGFHEQGWRVVPTTPPQRKPLTDEEIETYRYMIDWTAHWSYINFARAIEAAHGIKEKNT